MADLPEAYAHMFTTYAETGKTKWTIKFSHKSKEAK